MYGLYVTIVWLHILSAAVWVGGMVFFSVVVVPVLRHPDYRDRAGDLIQRTGRRYRVLGWSALGVLIATGTYLLAHRGVGWSDLTSPAFYRTSFGRTLGLKLSLVAATVVASLAHDLSMSPRATRVLREQPDGPKAARLRLVARSVGRLNLALALAIVALAVMIVRGAPW